MQRTMVRYNVHPHMNSSLKDVFPREEFIIMHIGVIFSRRIFAENKAAEGVEFQRMIQRESLL